MEYIEEIVDQIKPILKQYSFKKNGLNWIKEDNNCIYIFNIQRSQFGKSIYLNIGIQIKEISMERSKTINCCQIQQRLDSLIGKEYLNFENSIDKKIREDMYISCINSNPYSFFTLDGSKSDLIKFIKSSNAKAVFVTAKKYLDIED